jgi:biopolymer transport protein ExbD
MMKFTQNESVKKVEFDVTPMIDCTFQLVVFFLLTLNFSTSEQSALVRLPRSELAKPPEKAVEIPIVLQMTSSGTVLFNGDFMPPEELQTPLRRERQAIETKRNQSAADATIIIRADRNAKTGQVQEVIQICQQVGFEKFKLRAESALREIKEPS